MSTATNKPPISMPGDYHKTRREMSADEYQKWVYKHIAWAWDGTHIVAGAATGAELIEELRRLGIDTSKVVFGYMDGPESQL
jgi:hypothetical protein